MILLLMFLFKFIFLHNYWLELFHRTVSLTAFYLPNGFGIEVPRFCASNMFLMLCRTIQLLLLFYIYSNSEFSKALGLHSSNKVSVENFLFSRNVCLKVFASISISYFYTPLTEKIARRLRLLFLNLVVRHFENVAYSDEASLFNLYSGDRYFKVLADTVHFVFGFAFL